MSARLVFLERGVLMSRFDEEMMIHVVCCRGDLKNAIPARM